MKTRLCIVDDEAMIRELLSFRLTHSGYQVCSFSNPLEIADDIRLQAANGKHDLVITDINMPGMDGLSFVEKLVKSGFYPENIAIMSGSCTPDECLAANLLKVEKFFTKPIDINQMIEWIEKCRHQPIEKRQVIKTIE